LRAAKYRIQTQLRTEVRINIRVGQVWSHISGSGMNDEGTSVEWRPARVDVPQCFLQPSDQSDSSIYCTAKCLQFYMQFCSLWELETTFELSHWHTLTAKGRLSLRVALAYRRKSRKSLLILQQMYYTSTEIMRMIDLKPILKSLIGSIYIFQQT
jgi:hypothetical protein